MKTKLSLLAVAVLVSVGVHAQSIPEPLLQAARKAVVSNPEVQARWNGFQAAGEERGVARGGFFPKVDVVAGVGKENRKTPTYNYGGYYNYRGAELSLNQMLFDGMFTSSEVKRLGYAKLTRYYELLDASESAALEAVRAYADVVRYRELVEAATQNYIEHKQTAGQIEERVSSGVGRRADLEQATGRLALAESNLQTELTNLHDVSARYLRVVGEKPLATLPPLPEQLQLGTMPATVDVLMQEGLQGSPALNAAVENVRAYKQAIETSKAAYLPRFDLRGYKTWNDNRSNIPTIMGSTNIYGAELVMNYNLFRGGADMARERQAVELKEQARDLQEKTCRDVRQTLSIAYSDVGSLSKQLGYLGQHRLSTEKSREAYRQQFDLGQRTLLDLLDSQNEYFEASRAYISSRHNQVVAQARTLASMGKLVAALNVQRDGMPSTQDLGQDRGGIDPAELCPLSEAVVDTIEQIKAGVVIPSRARVAAPVAAPTKVRLSADTLFDFDKSVLKPEGKAELDTLVERIKGIKLDVVIAVGHTDSIGTDAYNNRLSMRRADSVKAYLVSKGIDAKRIKTDGKGESQPIADNASAEGRAKNRRVDIEVVELNNTAK